MLLTFLVEIQCPREVPNILTPAGTEKKNLNSAILPKSDFLQSDRTINQLNTSPKKYCSSCRKMMSL